MLKQMILCGGLLSSILPALCSEFVMDETKQLTLTISTPRPITDENIHCEFLYKLMQSIRYKDVQSLRAEYTDEMKDAKKKLADFSENSRMNLGKFIQMSYSLPPVEKEREALYSFVDKLQRHTKNNRNVKTNVSSQKKTWEESCADTIFSTLSTSSTKTYIWGYRFVKDTARGTATILLDNYVGYYNLAITLASGHPKMAPDAEAFLDLYILKSGNLPIKEYVRNHKTIIASDIKEKLAAGLLTPETVSGYYDDALNKMINKLINHYKNYVGDGVIDQAKSGNYPMLGSPDKKMLEDRQIKHPNDFQRAYINFVQDKYGELFHLYNTGEIRRVPRTDRSQIRQDFKKALKLMNDSTTMLADKFGGNNPIERSNFKITIADTEHRKFLTNLLDDDAHPEWSRYLLPMLNPVTNTQATNNNNSNSNNNNVNM